MGGDQALGRLLLPHGPGLQGQAQAAMMKLRAWGGEGCARVGPREVSRMVWWTGRGPKVGKWVVGLRVRPCSTGGGVARLCALRPWAKCAIRSTLAAAFKKKLLIKISWNGSIYSYYNTGWPHVVQYILEPVLHSVLCTSCSPTYTSHHWFVPCICVSVSFVIFTSCVFF